MDSSITPRKVIKTSLAVDITDFVFNSIVALVTGSSVILAEALQGLADLLVVLFLYIGIKRSARKPNRDFNFGYGRELYFWVLCSAIAMLIITATLSFYSGLMKVIYPTDLENTFWAYLVLVIAIVTNLYALSLSYKKLKSHPTRASIVKSFTSSRLIEIKTAFITDLFGTLSSAFGTIALILYAVSRNPQFDGLGAMIIALGIATFSIMMITEAKNMIVGRSVSPEIREEIRRIAKSHPLVENVLKILTMHFGSEEIYVNLNIKVKNNLETRQIEKLIEEIKSSIIKAKPEVDIVQVEIDSN
jgi:cation diffusion facilitator family transporter